MIIKSNFLKPTESKKMDFLQDYYLEIGTDGRIIYFGNDKARIDSYEGRNIIDMSDKVILPGMTDIHTHLPQYPALGLGKGALLQWLDDYIFPLEKKFSNDEYAYNSSINFYSDCIKFGTTTVVAYSNSSFIGTDSAFRAAKDIGIRAFIGMSMMDINAPNDVIHSTDENIINSTKLINKWHRNNSELLNYILTPRYALVCSEELMRKTAEIASLENIMVQTHLAENREELRNIKKLYPNYESYTEIYDKVGLINDNSILAHCIYLSDNEINLIREKNANIAHCPSSNRYLTSGIFPLDKFKDMIQVGIGTDVAGGTSLSMLNELKEAIETSKTYKMVEDHSVGVFEPEEAIWTSTKLNAKIMGLNMETGDFEIGLSADFVAYNIKSLQLEPVELNSLNISSKLIYLINNRYANNVFIRGKEIFKS